MEFTSLPLIQDFNKLYTDILNCDIIAPSFYIGRVPQSFVFKKRWAFSAIDTAETFDTIYDIYEEWNDTYYIWKIGSNVLVKKNSTTLYTWTYVAWVEYKFFLSQWPKWTVVDSWTWMNGSVSWADIILTDATKTWTINSYAGKYIYLYEADVWQWQVFLIDSNTATTLTVTSTGWKVQPSNAKYKIFNSYWYVLSFVAWDYIYNIQDITSVTPVKTIPTPMDAIYFNWNYYIVAQDKNIHVGWDGIFSAYFSWKSNIGSNPDTYNIINFKDYILLVWNKWISAIRNITRVDSTWASITERIILPVTSDIWIFKQWAYTIYNQWLYLISQNKKFIWVEITDVWIDKFTVTSKNQWIYIQQFLDILSTDNVINIWIDDANIYIVVKSSWKSTIFNYDTMYMWWHRWETLLPLTDYKLSKFVWNTLYIKWYDALKDEWDLEYNQNIRAVIWEDNIFLMKRALLTKLYIWKNTTKWAYIHYTSMAWWNVDKYIKKLEESKYIQDILWYSLDTQWTLWTNLLWLSLLWESLTSWLDLISDFALIENPTWFFYEICIIDIKWTWTEEFEFGWMVLWYNKFEPQVTSYYNVI